jgi:hypothetical protein
LLATFCDALPISTVFFEKGQVFSLLPASMCLV